MADLIGLVGRVLCAVVGIGAVAATSLPHPAGAAEHKSMIGDHAAIEKTMEAYGAALNGGNAAAVLPLYAEDGVFMAPYAPSAVGRRAVEAAYDRVFAELRFDVRFQVEEIVQVAPGWAFVRTNSAGTTLHRSTGHTTAEANQELFVLHRNADGAWRIARYSFSPTTPPAA